MKIRIDTAVRSSLAAFILLSAVTSSQAQEKKKLHPRWNWETHQVQTIDYAKTFPVNGIEANVPDMPFAEWFQHVVGRGARVDWEVNDCGEQTGTAADRGRDFPMCVEARTVKPGFFYISVDIQFGTFNRGINKMKPVVRSIIAGDEFGGEWLGNLSDLPKTMMAHENAPQHLDPNGGFFTPSEKPADAFNDVHGISVQTMKNAGDKYVWMPPQGGIEVGSPLYEFESVLIDGTIWQFETKKLGGVSYKFAGKFAKTRFDTDGKMIYEKVLSGHLTKLVKGKTAAETDMTFDYNTRPCKGCGQPSIFVPAQARTINP